MTYRLVLSKRARKQLKKMDKHVAYMLAKYMKKQLDGLSDPRIYGKALVGDKTGLWRYRLGDYRVICEMKDEQLVILALEIGHRKLIYK